MKVWDNKLANYLAIWAQETIDNYKYDVFFLYPPRIGAQGDGSRRPVVGRC